MANGWGPRTGPIGTPTVRQSDLFKKAATYNVSDIDAFASNSAHPTAGKVPLGKELLVLWSNFCATSTAAVTAIVPAIIPIASEFIHILDIWPTFAVVWIRRIWLSAADDVIFTSVKASFLCTNTRSENADWHKLNCLGMIKKVCIGYDSAQSQLSYRNDATIKMISKKRLEPINAKSISCNWCLLKTSTGSKICGGSLSRTFHRPSVSSASSCPLP